MKALHVYAEGLSAFFKHPLTITGTQISLPCPPYSTILGLISSCAGKVITYEDTRIGYEFRCKSTDIELERTDRLALDKKGRLGTHPDGKGILKRYVHFGISFDLYLTNLDLEPYFHAPISTPYLGRSQDLVWIKRIEQVELTPKSSGMIGPTMITKTNLDIPSMIIRCPEWFSNDYKGRTRIVGPLGFYQAILPTNTNRFELESPNLYHPSNLLESNHVIYLHDWIKS